MSNSTERSSGDIGDHKQNMPIIRFDFKDSWSNKKIKQLADVTGGGTPSTTVEEYWDGNINWYTPTEVGQSKYVSESERKITQEGLDKSSAKILPKNTILLTTRATIGRASITNTEATTNQGFQSIICKKVDLNFMYYLIQTLEKTLIRKSVGSTFLEISKKEIEKIKVNIPTLEEQIKIGDFLSLIDRKIELMEKKYNILNKYKRAYIQSLPLNCRKDLGVKNWALMKLSDLMVEHKHKSTNNEEVYSVSVYEGLINQIKHLGRSYSAEDTSKYNLVKPGDIVYTKSPTGDFPLGIIKQSHLNKNVIVSPLYGVFTPKSYELGYILESFFESPIQCNNYLHPLVQKGAKNTMNITNKTFLSKEMYIPTTQKDQKGIYDIIKTINTKLDLLKKELKFVKFLKKSLLSKMFC